MVFPDFRFSSRSASGKKERLVSVTVILTICMYAFPSPIVRLLFRWREHVRLECYFSWFIW